MSTLIEKTTELRQTEEWAHYMNTVGWDIEKIDQTFVHIRHIKPFKHSLLKIPHIKSPVQFDKIDELAKKHNALFALIQPSPINFNEAEYKMNGYIRSNMLSAFSANMLLDITKKPEDLFKSFAENARRNIKKAEAHNLIVKTIDLRDPHNDPYFDEFYALVEHVGKLKHFYTAPASEAHAKRNAFRKNEFLTLAYESQSQKSIAGIWFSIINKTVYYLHTGMTEEGYEKLTNYLLLWEGIKYAQTQGAEILDFEGIYDERLKNENKTWKGFTAFKERFHGEKVYYPLPLIKIYNIPYKVLYLCTSLFIR